VKYFLLLSWTKCLRELFVRGSYFNAETNKCSERRGVLRICMV